ncbi:MAG: SDR family oxidoreductase [Phycisphaerales bacterium]|nr:MAG: SDR family oxidoreductase [Phycisphaerales bacterium]
MSEPKPEFPRQKQSPPGLDRDLDPAPRWRGERYKPAGKLEGQAAIVTGGDSGIGRAVAYFFAREGADVLITCLPEEAPDAEEVQSAIEALDRRCVVMEGDLSGLAFCDRVVERAMEMFGRLDVLVHNAAWQNRKKITDLTEDELDTTMKVNVYAYHRLVRAAVPHMQPGASIIATGSTAGIRGSGELNDYGASKGAIHALTKSLAHELGEKQIRVNCVAPGPVWTPLNPSDEGYDEDDVAKFGKDNEPFGRPGQPEEIAPAFVYLASNADSSFVNGAILPVTGHPV